MGSIRKRGNRYQAQVRRQGQRSIGKSFIFRQDAERWIREVEAKIDRGEYEGLQPTALTLGHLLGRYQRDITPHKKGHEAETRRLNRLMRDSISDIALSALTGQQLASFRDRRIKDGKRACQYDLVLIRHAIEIGRKEWGLALPSNPVDLIRIPNGIKRRERRLEGDEWQRLEMASALCTNSYTWPAVQLALHTAMRRSELLKLTWEDVDLESRLAYLQDTKNGQPRAVPLTRHAMDVLVKLKKTDHHILPVTETALRQSWERLVKRAGVHDFRFHDFRHEAISRFFEIGLSVPEVALISGHKDVRMLFRYTHLKAEDVVSKLP